MKRLPLIGSLACFALLQVAAPTRAAEARETAVSNSAFSCTAYRFAAEEGWYLRAGASPGSRLEGNVLRFDFTRGGNAASLGLPDRVLLGRPEKFRLRVRGSAKGHPVSVQLRTHFMTFEKMVGEFGGDGEQELVFDAPPGHDWKWFGGENDGKLHGPLRLGEIRVGSGATKESGRLELLGIDVDGTCPRDKLCMLVADTRESGGQMLFRADVRAASKEPLEGDMAWTIKDWDGRTLTQGSKHVVVPAGGDRLDVDVASPAFPAGLKFAEAEFRLAIPGQVIPSVQTYWLAPVTPHDDPALRPESPFGMGVYLNRFRGADQEAVARAARDAGVKWSREDFGWARIEREPGKFDWSLHDRLVDVARANGITIYAIVAYFPTWSKGYTSEGIDQYAGFLRHLVARYKDRIRQWEIWNEPNIFFWQGPKELYAECLAKSYQAIKETDPAAEVLGISTAGIDYKFIEKMLAKNTPFDVLTIHPYRRRLDDAAFISDLAKASDLVKLPDGHRRPVWLTEMGWGTHVQHHALRQDFEPNSQRAQAELLARTYLCAIGSGVEPRTFWYDFRNDGDDPIYFEHNMGIMTRDLRPKPAYVAYGTLTRVLKGMRFAAPATVTAPAGTFAYRFTPDPRAEGSGRARNGVGEVIALWNPKEDATATVPLKGAAAALINTIGEARKAPVRDGRLSVVLSAGKVVYVEGQ